MKLFETSFFPLVLMSTLLEEGKYPTLFFVHALPAPPLLALFEITEKRNKHFVENIVKARLLSDDKVVKKAILSLTAFLDDPTSEYVHLHTLESLVSLESHILDLT
jgi:predicted 2-oxoglutarate/Fe(II)-dependent dioxygenase YbiX